jgi:hypothetical protein
MSAFGVEFFELQHRSGRLAMPAGVLGIARTSTDLARLPCVLTAFSLVLECQPCHVLQCAGIFWALGTDLARLPCVLTAFSLVLECQPCHVLQCAGILWALGTDLARLPCVPTVIDSVWKNTFCNDVSCVFLMPVQSAEGSIQVVVCLS